jgi:hypothetical protein
MFDQAGIVDDQRALAEETGADPGQGIGRLAPQLQRIAQNRPDDFEP